MFRVERELAVVVSETEAFEKVQLHPPLQLMAGESQERVPDVTKPKKKGKRLKSKQVVKMDLPSFDNGIATTAGGVQSSAEPVASLGVLSEIHARELFEAHDVDRNGYLDHAEFVVYLTSVFTKLLESESSSRHGGLGAAEMALATASSLFEEADTDGNGALDYDEFRAWFSKDTAIAKGRAQLDENEARRLFKQYDVDGDGVLDVEEFIAYLTNVFASIQHTEAFMWFNATPDEVAEATAVEYFAEADHDGNGTLNFAEFKDWYLANDPNHVKQRAPTAQASKGNSATSPLSATLTFAPKPSVTTSTSSPKPLVSFEEPPPVSTDVTSAISDMLSHHYDTKVAKSPAHEKWLRRYAEKSVRLSPSAK